MVDFIKNISPVELGIAVLILIILFGSRIITHLAKSAGESLKEIKKVKTSFTEALDGENKAGDSK